MRSVFLRLSARSAMDRGSIRASLETGTKPTTRWGLRVVGGGGLQGTGVVAWAFVFALGPRNTNENPCVVSAVIGCSLLAVQGR